jgi:hypothetical protein
LFGKRKPGALDEPTRAEFDTAVSILARRQAIDGAFGERRRAD